MNLDQQLSNTELARVKKLMLKKTSKMHIEIIEFDKDKEKMGFVEVAFENIESRYVGYRFGISQAAYYTFIREKEINKVDFKLEYVNDQYPESISTDIKVLNYLPFDLMVDTSFCLQYSVDIDHYTWMKVFFIEKSGRYFTQAELLED